jgi:hypothetical protein
MNAHLAGAGQAYDTADASDRPHLFRKLQAHIHGRSYRHGPLRFYQQTFHDDVYGFTFDLLAADAQAHFRTHRHTPRSATLVFEKKISKGGHQWESLHLEEGWKWLSKKGKCFDARIATAAAKSRRSEYRSTARKIPDVVVVRK